MRKIYKHTDPQKKKSTLKSIHFPGLALGRRVKVQHFDGQLQMNTDMMTLNTIEYCHGGLKLNIDKTIALTYN